MVIFHAHHLSLSRSGRLALRGGSRTDLGAVQGRGGNQRPRAPAAEGRGRRRSDHAALRGLRGRGTGLWQGHPMCQAQGGIQLDPPEHRGFDEGRGGEFIVLGE